MKLAEIQIDRCGVWQNLTLPLEPHGLNVLYGPNEAGKSTLVRFLSGVLYGFNPAPDATPDERAWQAAAGGSVLLEQGSDRCRIFRSAGGATRGAPRVVGDEAGRSAQEFLAEALHQVDERTFQSLFSIDLRQLQELGTLNGDEAAARIYGVSLGLDGLRLIEAGRRSQLPRARLVDPLQRDGTLVRLFERHDHLAAELRQLDEQRAAYDERCRRRDEWEQQISDLRQRQAGIGEQLRGHQFLQRSWGPWSRQRDGRHELSHLPEIARFPEQGLERLDAIESEIAAAAESRDRLLATIRQLRQELPSAVESDPIQGRLGTMRGLVEQQGWLREVEERREATRRCLDDAERHCTAALDRLGKDWSVERLQDLDLSAAGWQRLSGTAQSLQRAVARKHGLKRKCDQLTAACRERRQSLADCLRDLKGQPIETALHEARERLRQMNHLARLQIREADLNQRQFSLIEHRDSLVPQLNLPRWVYIVLGVFSFMGIILAGWGLIAGVATSGIAGAIYALLGITCGGLAWGLRYQFEGDARRRLEEAATQYAATQSDLREVRSSIAKLAGDVPASGSGESAPLDGAELVRRATERVAELVDLAQHDRNVRSLRRRLETCRQKLYVARREVVTARQAWQTLLTQIGLPDSVPPVQALEAWQWLLEAHESALARDQAIAAHAATDGLWSSCRRRVAELGRRLEAWDVDYDQPVAVLETWELKLDEIARQRKERRQVKSQIRVKRREAARHRARVQELKVQRDALLVQAGAASRDEFEERGRLLTRRQLLEEQCAAANAELEAIGSEHADLALVEEDLLAYDAQENQNCIEALQLESADLEQDIQQAQEELHGVLQSIREIEDDRQSTSLRFDLEQVRGELHQAAREWAATELAAQVCDELRRDFERRHQPQALVAASSILSRLSQGRYSLVWTPLGERRLMVDDETGRSLPAAALSRGTREQLFLAVRLAVVEEMARNGVTLPLILDDVFVNFDDRRAEAAAEVLSDFAQAGRQVLFFTCHLHLARLFQAKGIEPIWLPDHREESKEREEQRRAG